MAKEQQGLTTTMVYALLKQLSGTVYSLASGIKSFRSEGLKLYITPVEGEDIEIEFPTPVDVENIELKKDEVNDAHLVVSLENGTVLDAGVIPAGLSAYDLAVQVEGFEGTEAEWLATLPGRRNPVRFNFDASTEWRVQHNQNDQYVSCRIFDEEDDIIQGDIEYYSANLLIIRFEIPVKGYVIIN